jgi:hypothetical protein
VQSTPDIPPKSHHLPVTSPTSIFFGETDETESAARIFKSRQVFQAILVSSCFISLLVCAAISLFSTRFELDSNSILISLYFVD